MDSSVLAFEIAARMCMREGMKKAGAKLLEPIMKVEVITPEEYTGGIIGDLTSRRGQVSGHRTRGNAIAIDAIVPLANMFGYINTCVHVVGPRPVHHAVRPLRSGAAEHLGRDSGEIRINPGPGLNARPAHLKIVGYRASARHPTKKEAIMAKEKFERTNRTSTLARLATLTTARRR